jgi:hypothetical protein
MGRRAKPKKGTPARKSAKNGGSQVRDLEKRLAEALQREAAAAKREAEALEQQTATSEILRAIGGSPTDVQPVFDAIARSGVTVCEGLGCAVFVVDVHPGGILPRIC